MKRNERGITLIALVVTIVVLLILAAVSISMLTGENGIITQAQESKLQTEIGKEKEYITLSVSAIRGEKISKGDTSEITSSELQTEMNKYTNEATVTGSGILTVAYESGRSYEVEQNGNITQKEELTPEEAKKIVFATGCEQGILVETADETVYYVSDLQEQVMQKIEITDAEVITTNGIKETGDQYFIDNEGKVYTWGDNSNGQLGNGTYEYSDKPICISDIPGNVLNGKNIVKMQSNNMTIAIDSEGKVYTWGDNGNGQLGNGTDIEYSNNPQCISDIKNSELSGKKINSINTNGYTVIAIDNAGKVYTWGYNYSGQLGNGTDEYTDKPICISDIDNSSLKNKNVISTKIIGELDCTILSLDNEGKVYTWGNNDDGQLGYGTDIEYSNNPQCISDMTNNELNGKKIVRITSSRNTVSVLDDNGKVYSWGNNYGKFGDGTYEGSNKPICISNIKGNTLNGKNIVDIINYNNRVVIARDSEGKVYTWGENEYGQLGSGTEEYENYSPTCISDIPGNALNGKNIVDIKLSGDRGTIIVKDSEGKVYTWGDNGNGQLGSYIDNEFSNEPKCLTDDENSKLYNKKIRDVITSISRSGRLRFYIFYITKDGELYNYGYIIIPD